MPERGWAHPFPSRQRQAFDEKMKNLSRKKSKAKWALIFLIPWFIQFAVFQAYPLFYGIYVSFTDFSFKSISAISFVGLENYKAIPADPAFFRSVVATIGYSAFIIPLTIVISLWVSFLLQGYGNRMNTFSKVLIYLPGVTCTAALVIVWKFIFMPGSGLISGILSSLGYPMFSLFDDPMTSISTLSILIVFATLGQPVILYSAAMNNIPTSYYEAAEIDGASRTKQFFSITMPLLHTTNIFVVVTTTIGILQVFAVPYLMTGGGPQYKTSSFLLMVYKSAFQNGSFGYASAVGIVLFIITAIIAAIQFRLMRREAVEY